LQQDELELQAVCGFELSGDHDWNDIFDFEIFIEEAPIESHILSCRLVEVDLNVLFKINGPVIVNIAIFNLVLVKLGFLVLQCIRLEEVLTGCLCLDVLVLTRGVLLDNLPVLGIQELSLLETKLAQITRQQPVLFLCALRVQLNTIAANSVECVANDEVVTTADLVFETASDAQFDQDCLGQLRLDLDHGLRERVTFWV